ncbi:glycine rich domain-containing protein [Anaerocolumna sp. AGMB13025]|uniref:glycine rich domain-containing protein n=1 Tax=Anaerocolumna sp. AGMB13025 TaxID=3039116 RepID=UPI00241C019E|nr:glycine rich domain-containing protein [Anaerocolumna sp. AGMB13025]WFR59583.1 glycine rich domain-containing protein [Anaerocolumna sp. AGMB13025]
MFRILLQKITKLSIIYNTKIRNKALLALLAICCMAGIVGLKFIQTSAAGITLATKGSAVVPGVSGSGAEIWPVTHPVFIVQLYDTGTAMSTETDGYDKQANNVRSVIPYASTDAMWLCTNDLSAYLIRKGFNSAEEVYMARKSSATSTELTLQGGKNDPTTIGRIVYLSKNECTDMEGEKFKEGIFYKTLYNLYTKNNRSFVSLASDQSFTDLLSKPTSADVTTSARLWSYITDVDAQGSNESGWKYTADTKPRIDKFLHLIGDPKKDLDLININFNNWSETSSTVVKMKDSNIEITAGESLDLRYLDLLMTLSAISNNKEYWKKGIIDYMTKNEGLSNISITQGIVARMDRLVTKSGAVEPATVFVSDNDLCQIAYKVNSTYNLSTNTSSEKVFSTIKSTDYNKRLKEAVTLSKPSSYLYNSIFSSAIISRIIPERVRNVKNGKLVWGDSYNDSYLISLLKFKLNNTTWYGANWVLEPPIAPPAVNYNVDLKIDSENLNKSLNINGPVYDSILRKVNLNAVLKAKKYKSMDIVTTEDEVRIQVKLNAMNIKGGSGNITEAINEWKKFISTNTIKQFRIKVELYRDNGGTDFDTISKGDRKFKQIHSEGKEWCISTDWNYVTPDVLLELLSGKEVLGEFSDSTIKSVQVETEIPKDVSWCSKVTIQYQTKDKSWFYTTGKKDGTSEKLICDTDIKKIVDIRQSNKAYLEYNWIKPHVGDIDYPTATWTSQEPSLAYAELKEGSIYNETFEAMAGVPTTRTLYFSSGGNEFMADLQLDYEYDVTATREYITHYNGTECEYKTNDQLKGGTEAYTRNETFVGDAAGKTISKNVVDETSKIVTPNGKSSANLTVNGHTSETTLWSQWIGTITNSTKEPSDIGSFNAGRAGSPCAGLGFDVGTLRTKAEPSTDWSVSAYNTALNQAIAWAASMEATNSSFTVQKIADSDGQSRQYTVGDAVITVTLNGGDNSYSHTTLRSYSGGTYTSSSASGALLNSNDKGKLGNGWGWSDGKLGVGSGYSDCGHGHGASGWHTEPKPAVPPDSEGHGGSPAVPGVPHTHNCGTYTPGTDLTQGASGTIEYTIKVTFKNGTLKAANYDGNSSDVSATTITGLTGIPAHALCGPCCAHDLPAIEDVWYQDSSYDTIMISKCNVYKLQNGYATAMSDITYDGNENIIAKITQGDPNIFYNIAADNGPVYDSNNKLTNPSKIGRIRYSLQEAQGDKVYYEEMSSGDLKRTNKCDGLMVVQSPQNPAPPAKTGHQLGYGSGTLYSNGKTAGYGTAPALNITTIDQESDNTATAAAPKTAYGNTLDAKDLLTEEWKRFYTRRTQPVTATIISDMLILQTSSGDQSPVYYAENTKAVKAQEDFNSLIASGDITTPSTQDQVDAKWEKLWTNNATSFAKTLPTAINVGSYNGKYNETTKKYQGTGNKAEISTRFDEDKTIFSTPEDELGLARVNSKQSFTKPANGTTNISSPGKAQARMDRVTDLRIFVDKIKQNPTNKNAQYETGNSYVFYIPILKYTIEDEEDSDEEESEDEEDSDKPIQYDEKIDKVLAAAGYNYGPGLTYKSKYSAYNDNSDYKVNNIVTLDSVSTQYAMVEKSNIEDQRTEEGIVKDAMDTLKALEKCPGTPELCEYRELNCKYTLDTTSLSFKFENTESDNADIDDGEDDTTPVPEEEGSHAYDPYPGQYITNDILNDDGAHTTFNLPSGVALITADPAYAGFGTGQFLKVNGNGTRLNFPYNDCRVYLTGSSRVKLSADLYIPVRPAADTMLFSIGGAGLYIPANTGTPVFITSTGQKRTGAVDIVGRKVKITATFSLGSLYDCELSIDGTKVISQIVTGLTEEQIAAAAINQDMRGSGLNIGCWDKDNTYATDFFLDNVVITRCGGTLQHTASCYTTYKQNDMYYQDIYNGLIETNNNIDWTASYKKVTSTDKIYEFPFTGSAQSITLPAGTYMLEAWGAQGGNSSRYTTQYGGLGGYTSGIVKLNNPATVYVYVGGQGGSSTATDSTTDTGGWNGGGSIASGQNLYGAPGGGATDFRLINGDWNNMNGLKSRILVAGGGGGANSRDGDSTTAPAYYTGYGHGAGGAGGGLTGGSGTTSNQDSAGLAYGYSIGTGGTQINGGSTIQYLNGKYISTAVTGTFGAGTGSQSGGGGGYYGGGYSGHGGGGGGSSYVTGYTGCDTTFKTSQGGFTFTDVNMDKSVREGNGFARITAVTGQTDTNPYSFTSIYSKHVHNTSCLTQDSRGYQIALSKAKSGDWSDLKKELGNQLFNKVIEHFNIDTTSNLPDGMITKSYDGKLWGRVFYQDSSTGQYFGSEAEALHTNSTYKFSCLDQIQNYKADTKYEFMLYYPENGQTNIWKQTNRPQDELETNGDGTQNAAGYEAKSIQMNGNFWGGLVKSTSGASLIDGSTYHGNWFYAIGSYTWWGSENHFPGGNDAQVTKVELWMAINPTGATQTPNPTPSTPPPSGIPSGTVYNYGFTGYTQTVTLPAGTYKLETWGAQGGVAGSYIGGKGGYSTGTLTVTQSTVLNINVGQQGQAPSGGSAWNGGGSGICCGGSGGGATDIRTGGAALQNRIIVAGGGGGASLDTPYSNGGYAGGLSGESNDGGSIASQSSGYSLGIGQDCYTGDNAGGGGGYYGGYAGVGSTGGRGGGGSSYIGGVQNGITIAGNSSMPTANGSTEIGHTGSGYARITVIESEPPIVNPTGPLTEGQIYNYKYTGNVQSITLPAGTYKLEAWGAQGGNNYSVADESGRGQGGYTSGTIKLKEPTTLYMYVGQQGASGNSANYLSGTYNGGGAGMAPGYTADGHQGGQGGGATDFRLTNGIWNSLDGLRSRILVAGGGGGTGCASVLNPRGDGGGLIGKSTYNNQPTYLGSYATGGTQTAGGDGYSPQYPAMHRTGSFGYGADGSQCGAGGGGGYYGGGSAYTGGGGGGSSYVSGYAGCDSTYRTYQGNAAFSDVSMVQGGRTGNGYARVTVISINRFPNDTELFNYIKDNMSLIPDTITTGDATIVNPIWTCKTKNNTGETFTEKTILTCTEPHHSGGHYDYSNSICWDACHKDENHKKTDTQAIDANGKKIEQATYITLDNFFKVYFPNNGDFLGNGAYGILQPSIYRGKGFTNSMDTTEWTREKYVKFDYDVLYDRNGTWESYLAGEWIPLEIIDRSTTHNYSFSGNILYVNGEKYVLDRTNHLLTFNDGSTTLVEGGTMAVMNGWIFELKEDGTVDVSKPYSEYNFYCVLENNEHSAVEVQFSTEAINYDEQSTKEAPYNGNDQYEEEYDIYAYGNTYVTNKDRFGDFTSNHSAGKLGYIDVVGRIGNLIIEDSDDLRFSNYFKKSTAFDNDDWLIQGIIAEVDSSISEHYLSWHRNSAGYPLAVDVRGEQVSKDTGYYNTWGAQEWTTKAESNGLGVSADKNSNTLLQSEQLKLGYNVLFDVTTMGDYNQYLQVIPYFYALNKKTNALTPVDVYISNDGLNQPINYFGLYSDYMDEDGNYKEGYETLADQLYKYTMYLNWTNESARRNYTAGGKESSITDAVRDFFIEPIRDSTDEITGYKYLTVPFGNFYNLGTMQCLQPGLRARTFVGSSQVTAIQKQAARLGLTNNGINGGTETNINGDYSTEMFNHQAQRWHLTLGVPSSAVFTAYREKGIHVLPADNWYIASYIDNGVTQEKTFSKPYLISKVGDKDYGIGTTFQISGVQYTVTGTYQAGAEFNNNSDYVILMTADIKAIGDKWNLKYNSGNDNGYIMIDGSRYNFDNSIPTFIAAYDTVSSLVDISTQQTH